MTRRGALPWAPMLALAVIGVTPLLAAAQVTRPRALVGRFELTPAGDDVRITLWLERRGAAPRRVEVATAAGPCTEDVGGLDSLAVVHCQTPSGEVRVFELMQVGARIAIDEQRGRAGGELRRMPRRFVGHVPRRFTFVPRCEETLDDPLACPPPR